MANRLALSRQIGTLALLTLRQARRLVILVIGTTVLLLGAAMVVLPGPGLLVIPVGLAILAVEFAFARRWLSRLRSEADHVRDRLLTRVRRRP